MSTWTAADTSTAWFAAAILFGGLLGEYLFYRYLKWKDRR